MKIAWLTPFGGRSAIGRVSEQVVRELDRREGVEVDVWYPAEGGGRRTDVRARPLPQDQSAAVAALAGYDHLVHNLGNHAGNHVRIMDLSRRLGGVVVLHDVSLIHLTYERLLARGPETFRHFLARWYGDEGETAATDALADVAAWPWAEGTVERFPMLAPALSGADAVLTHSGWAADRVRQEYLGDVFVAPLPHLPSPAVTADEAVPRLDDDVVMVLQAGAMNPDKRIDTVIEAFSLARVAPRAHLVVCGDGTPEALRRARGLAHSLGLDDSVTVLGRVSDRALAALRSRADVATVLRQPSSEAASAVLVDSLAADLAVVTVSAGCYREVPEGAVLHVPVPTVVADVAAALGTLVEDAGRRAELQRAGRRYVDERHRVEEYADTVLASLGVAGAAGRRERLAEDLGDVARRLHAPPDGDLVRHLAEVAHELFGASPRVLPPYSRPA